MNAAQINCDVIENSKSFSFSHTSVYYIYGLITSEFFEKLRTYGLNFIRKLLSFLASLIFEPPKVSS